MSEGTVRGAVERREFLKATELVAATGSMNPSSLLSSDRASPVRLVAQQQQEQQLIPLGNGESPALSFQAYPGGTGSLMDKLWAEHGSALFERTPPITLDPWEGPIPTDEEDIAFLPVHRLSVLLRDRSISSVELTQIYLDRLIRYDPILLCAVSILEGRAMEEAQQADGEIRSGNWRGPLHGIPYGVKDLFSVEGTRTTWGSEDFEDQVINEDSEVVERLRTAGAVLIAKLATGEFARGDQWYRGRTRNPWNIEEGSSGSSAGPGSATAAGCVAFAIGTETRGSIVSPSRRNGLSALRPTYGRVSRYGGMVLSWSMDKTGPMCRSVEDCAHVFHAIHGASERDPASLTTPFAFEKIPDLGDFRIGFTEDAPETFLEALTGLGADVTEMTELPAWGAEQLGVESASAFDFHIAPGGVEPDPLPDDLDPAELSRRSRFRNGRDTRGMDYVNEQRRRLILMREMA
ncbi:MAG: amidase, partial [Gemmatimonadetes bacterium]|nr:amidase [Gemmatimonadota bacterium]